MFGALLDRGAGGFRFGPFGINVPRARIYEPGTNLLVTSWKTPTGWLVVRDAPPGHPFLSRKVEPPSEMLKGLLEVLRNPRSGFIAYAQGWGGLYIRANKLAWKQIHRHSGLGIKNRFGIPDCPERVHWEHEFATAVGAPGAYDYGPERCSWLTHHLTNWMGDDGFLRRAHCKIRRHNPEGDTLRIDGITVGGTQI